jgi:hypothetical protein
MARGIISTILGGVAGGFEGLAADQRRKREEEERRLERESESAQREFMNRLTFMREGGEFALPETGVRQPAREYTPRSVVGAALDSASVTPKDQVARRAPGEVDRIEDKPGALAAQAERGQSLLDRGTYTRFAGPGFEGYMPTRAELDRRAIEEEERQLKLQSRVSASDRERENRTSYRTLANIYPGVGEYDPEVDYGFVLDRQVGLERIDRGRTPARPEAPEPTPRERFVGWIQDQLQGKYNPELGIFEVPTDDQIVALAERIAPALGVGAREAVGILQDIGMMPMEPPPPPGGGTGTADDLSSLPRAIGNIERREQRREADAAAEAEVERRLDRDLNAYTRYLITNPDNADIRAAREAIYRQLSEINPVRYRPIQRSREEEIQRYTGWGG